MYKILYDMIYNLTEGQRIELLKCILESGDSRFSAIYQAHFAKSS